MAAVSSSHECLSNLLCAEDASNVVGSWDDDDDEEEKIGGGECEEKSLELQPCSVPEFLAPGEEHVSGLVEKECHYMPLQSYRDCRIDFAAARESAIGWILKVHAYYSFGPLTVYLSINYLDRFLSRYQLPHGKAWMLQLLSVACVSLAAKMEETDVPLLLDLQLESPQFLFEPRTVKRMELLVLTTLEWRMLSVTPFSFIDYFFYRGGNSSDPPPRTALVRATEIILDSIRGIDFVEYRPSAIAGAAVISAAEQCLPSAVAAQYREGVLSCSTVNKDSILSCYSRMQRHLGVGGESFSTKAKASQCVSSSSIPQSPVGVLDAFCHSISNNSNSRASSLEESLRSVNLYASVAAKRRKLDVYCNKPTTTTTPNCCR